MTKPSGYSATQIGLHWIVVLLIVLQYVLHDGITAAWEAVEEGREAASGLLVPMHILGGVLIAALALWRLALRARRGTPPPPAGAHPALDLVARVTHGALYLLMLLLPLSGALAWFGGVETAAGIHVVLTTLLLVLAALHVAAALFHHFVLKDGLLNRMGRPAP
jgi:cytochrome b561